ncbi:L-ectoine synthase [Mangrovactinospora gilvigrisea]|uniref:L-ectoine synthase n=1 Tax=Mangrovactinospora gilvigrisea TaxID=1428644 RepID=A0A1J7BJU5_9ACTN|nr:ectoine synthase [Mangrovactinospora gilvigrisea]OIV38955.1 L-ectoine synthase [Mangrovactinospora gilvigrisea]
MLVRSLDEVTGTDRDVTAETGTWRSRRIILAKEGVGFSVHHTIMYAGTETEMWYANHIEAVYCVQGEGELTDEETGEKHWITPGTLYLLDKHDRHTMRPKTDLHFVCVFNPPVTGREVHDENGVYPLMTEEG